MSNSEIKNSKQNGNGLFFSMSLLEEFRFIVYLIIKNVMFHKNLNFKQVVV